MTLRPVKIASLATYVPPRLLTNADLEKMVETSDEWIQQRTGIRERHIVSPGMATSDLAAPAAVQAICAGRSHPRRHRLDRRRHDDARHDLSEHGVRAAGAHRRHVGMGVRPGRRLFGVPVLADRRMAARRDRHGGARAGGRRRRDVEHHRLHRPGHLRAVRRRRRRDGALGGRAGGAGDHRRHQPHRRYRRAGALHARGRQPDAGIARDRRQAVALRQTGRRVGLQVRRADDGGDLRAASSRRTRSRPGTSACLSRTRRTAASSKPPPPGSVWTSRRSSSISKDTGTPRPAPSRSRSTTPAATAG